MTLAANKRSGVSRRVVVDVASRLREIRALWCAVQNAPELQVAEVAAEFYFVVGELLDGRTLQTASLRLIDKAQVVAHLEEF